MIRKSKEGQSLVEFALLLPILLLLLLGIVEASRVIWAYITVQTAAREAARYAVTGKPYIFPENIGAKSDFPTDPNAQCTKPDPETRTVGGTVEVAADPWLCSPESRSEAVRNKARERGETLMNIITCPADEQPAGFDPTWNCNGRSGVFGVQVVGQVYDTELLVAGEDPYDQIPNHAGTEGLNVLVSTFYNVQMITPIYDSIVGNSPITVRGAVMMQNEGVDPTLGSVPPPSLAVSTVITGATRPSPTGGNEGQVIYSGNGYGPFVVGDMVDVVLENHNTTLGLYDVMLQNVATGDQALLCSSIATNNQDFATLPCELPLSLVPGQYCLFSKFFGAPGVRCNVNAQAQATEYIVIESSGSERVVVKDSATGIHQANWVVGTEAYVQLLEHDPTQSYNVYLLYGGSQELIKASVQPDVDGTANLWPPTWDIPSFPGGSPCSVGGGTPCRVVSRITSTNVSEVDIYITEPRISLVAHTPGEVYLPGNLVRYEVSDHAANQRYDVVVREYNTGSGLLGAELMRFTVQTNRDGENINLSMQIDSLVDGTYKLSTHPVGVGSSQADLNDSQLAVTADYFEVGSSTDPYLTIVDDIQEWPVGSCLSVKLHEHALNTEHYLEIDGARITDQNSGGEIIETDGQGMAIVEYCIPLDATGNTERTAVIESYQVGPPSAFQASIEITILPTPLINIYDIFGNEIDTAVVSDTIIIQLTNHVPRSDYRIIYAERQIAPRLGTSERLTTDADGTAVISYSLSSLPRTYDDRDPITNLGRFYDMYSQEQFGGQRRVVTTELRLRAPDLLVTDIVVDGYEPTNSSAPVQLAQVEQGGSVIQNYINQPITLTFHYANQEDIAVPGPVDLDFYRNPTPIVPSFRTDIYPQQLVVVFPGDYKQWYNGIGPNDTFTAQQSFVLDQYGEHDIYSLVDTSNFMIETDELNNVLSQTIVLSCQGEVDSTGNTNFTEPTLQGASRTIRFNGDYDPAQDGISYQFGANGGSVRVENEQLVIDHSAGSIYNPVTDQHFAHFIADPLFELSEVYVQVLKAPTDNVLAGAGIEIKAVGPNNLIEDPQRKRVYLHVSRSGSPVAASAPDPYDFKLAAGKRGATRESQQTTASPRLKPYPSALGYNPVWLRIVRTGSTFSFYYSEGSGNSPGGWIPFPTDTGNFSVDLDMNTRDFHVSLYGSNDPNNTASSIQSESIFDNLTLVYKERPTVGIDADWETITYGDDTSVRTEVLGNSLYVTSNGRGSTNRNDAGSGYLWLRRRSPTTITTDSGFQMDVTINGMEDVVDINDPTQDIKPSPNGMAGLEIRNSDDERSAKLQFGLRRNDDNSTFTPYAFYRSQGGLQTPLAFDESVQLSLAQATSLRIVREDVTGLFSFYYKVGGGGWVEYDASTPKEAEPISNQVEVGLFNVSNDGESYLETEFSSFRLSFRSCKPASANSANSDSGFETDASGAPTNPPPGLRLCQRPIEDGSFEQQLGIHWRTDGLATARSGEFKPYEGAFKISAPTFDSRQPRTPYFYQEFVVPSWIVSGSTELDLTVYYNVDSMANGPEADDQFKVAVVRTPPSGSVGTPSTDQLLTEPVVVADGDDVSQLGYAGDDWRPANKRLQFVDGVNLEDEIGQTRYLVFYNDSNTADPNCQASDSCFQTRFFFDNANLGYCTTSPKPADGSYSTHIQGQVTLFVTQRDGSILRRVPEPGEVKIWAYTEFGELYETVNIANGEYNFYDLPASATGNRYVLYAEAPIRRTSQGQTEVILLADDRTATLRSGQEVLNFNLDLFDVGY